MNSKESNTTKTMMLNVRDVYLRSGAGCVRSVFPSVRIDAIKQLSSVPINEAEELIEKMTVKTALAMPGSKLREDINNILNGESELAKQARWLRVKYEASKTNENGREIRNEELDCFINDRIHFEKQIMYLARMGFCKRNLYTIPVSDRNAKGERIEPFKLAQSVVSTTLKERRINDIFRTNTGKVPIDDNWPTNDGKKLGKLKHRVANRKGEVEVFQESAIVLVAMFLAQGKDALKSVFTLMRTAEVFKIYKELRMQMSDFVNRETLDIVSVYGLLNDLQQMQQRLDGHVCSIYECKKCGIPFYSFKIRPCPFCESKNGKRVKVIELVKLGQ